MHRQMNHHWVTLILGQTFDTVQAVDEGFYLFGSFDCIKPQPSNSDGPVAVPVVKNIIKIGRSSPCVPGCFDCGEFGVAADDGIAVLQYDFGRDRFIGIRRTLPHRNVCRSLIPAL